jgi:hypothetical protein
MMRDLAERLIAAESRGEKSPEVPGAISLVVERLRPDLQTLMGSMGFRALLSRALAKASAEYAWLSALHVKSDGSLEGLSQLELESHVTSGTIADGRAALLAQLLGLLTSFIGESVTLRLVRNIWPNVPLGDLDSGEGKDK